MSLSVAILLSIINNIYGQTECTYATSSDNYVTFCDLNNTLRAQLIERFDQGEFHDLIAKAVRLVFHDCMGPEEYGDGTISAICDGCIDINNPSHAGLEDGAMARLSGMYNSPDNKWYQRMSRADYWAAAATIAIQYSNELSMTTDLHGSEQTNDSLPYIPFYIGREDCSTSPEVNTDNYPSPYKSFPDALKGFNHNYQLFQDSFDFTEQEYAAILGAHTLGRVSKGNSGFGDEDGQPWVEGWDILDNEFYHLLLDDVERSDRVLLWEQQEVTDPLDGETRYEWVDTNRMDGSTRFVMLNSDMSLLFDIDDQLDEYNGGQCSCIYDECPFNDISETWVRAYADNNQLWLTHFGEAFRKMIVQGYDVSLNPSDLEVLAEDWYLTENNISYDTLYCDPIINYDKTYEGYRRYSSRMGTQLLLSTLDSFEAEYPDCGDPEFLEYYYQINYDEDADEYNINTVMCCGDGAIWSDDFVAPDGYDEAGAGVAFVDFDDEDEGDDVLMKQIIVYCVCGLMVILCCIVGVIFYKKCMKKKEVNDKVVNTMIDNAGDNEQQIEQVTMR